MSNFIAKQVKAMREKSGLTQTELAKAANVSVAYISRLESGGYQSLTLDVCQKLAKGLELSLKDFLSDIGLLEDDKTPNTSLILQNALRSDGFGLTVSEVKDVIQYVEFIRHKRKN